MSTAAPASTTSSYEPFFRMRLNNIDHVLTKPMPSFDRLTSPFASSRAPLKHVPVLRIFGATPAGQRVCAHIHGIFPYLYVAYNGSLDPKAVLQYIDKLGRNLNSALAATQALQGKDVRNYCGIAAINLVKGTPFYGYHVGWSYFLKVSFINPQHSSRLITMLESGRILATRFTVFEGHIRYQLQFMLDYNLLGCGFVDFEDVLFRLPVPSGSDHAALMSQPSAQSLLWNDETIPQHCLPQPSPEAMSVGDAAHPPRSSYCTLELDATSQSILNRRLLRPRPIHRSYGEAAHTKAHSQGNIEKLVPSLNGLWEEEAQRRRAEGLPPSVPTPQTLGDDRVDPNNEQRGKWQDEERLYSLLANKMRQDTAHLEQHNAKPGDFLKRHEMDRFILTTFESVEAFQLQNVHGARKKKKWRAPPATIGTRTQAAAILEPRPPMVMNQTIAIDFSKLSGSESASGLEDESHPRLSQERFEASKVYDLLKLQEENSTSQPDDEYASEEEALTPALTGRREQADDRAGNRDGEHDQEMDVSFFASQQFIDAVAAKDRDVEDGLLFPSVENEGRSADLNPDGGEDYVDLVDEGDDTLTPSRTSRTPTPSRGSSRYRGGRSMGEGAMWGPPPGATPPSGQGSSKQQRLVPQSLKRKADSEHSSASQGSAPHARRRTVTFEATSPEGHTGFHSHADDDVDMPQTPSKRRGKMSDLVLEPTFDSTPPRKLPSVPWQPSSTIKTPGTAPSSSTFPSSFPSRLPQDGTAHLATRGGANSQEARTFAFSIPPPTRFEVVNSFGFFGLPSVEYRDPYFSNPKDLPTLPRQYGGKLFRFSSVTLPYLREFRHDEAAGLNDNIIRSSQVGTNLGASSPRGCMAEGDLSSSPTQSRNEAMQLNPGSVCSPKAARPATDSAARKSWQYGVPPPTRRSVLEWGKHEDVSRQEEKKRKQKLFQSQIAKPTPSSFGFKISQHPGAKFANRDKQHMTILVVEVHVCTRGSLLPDPKHDEISAIVYNFKSEGDDTDLMPASRSGVIMLRPERCHPHRLALPCDDVFVFDSELDVLMTLVDVVRELDPEILAGYEIHNSSWGYIIERAAKHFEFNIVPELGRIKEDTIGGELNSTGWDFAMSSALRVTGRHILNIWRLMRGELALNLYTFENVVYHLLHKRVPKFSHATLTHFHISPHVEVFCRPLRYWLERIQLVQDLIESSDLVFRTAEFARVYGIDFFSVINRGSQFKVESVMLRIAKPESFVLLSPNVKQRESQNAIECFPLVMEPQSAFYKGPLLVLDFQSLYPSLMIAYNICYSTCLGRVEPYKGTSKFGCTEYDPQPGALTLARDRLHVSPNGMIYVKPDVRKSLLAKMLSEILDTRVMVKGSMKGMKDDKAFQRQQNARQLSLKLLANVTYGYTSATWSGRMPCVEIADSIVQYGRETLENSIRTIHATAEWEAQVVYGDTDSLFIYLPGRSKMEAFRIGQEIADKITSLNPRPVKLKFEKVYLPCVLLAKKRYVGYKFESLGDKEAVFDAKGIETVRRDGHAALQRMLETCIRTLFTSQDLTLVKEYCQEQWRKILEGRISIQDFIFAKEVRLGGYSEKGVPPPGAVVATRKLLADHRAEPQHAERVPYIISQGAPGAKLNDQAVPPEVMLQNPSLRINSMYYITRTIIPPLSRVFNLLGADVAAWFRDMPHALKRSDMPAIFANAKGSKSSVSDHFRQEVCLVCGFHSDTG
ncbi:DNA polymerase zeta [Tilletia horrida]|nr:DNA polymerase zeta [Tilletia horrida]